MKTLFRVTEVLSVIKEPGYEKFRAGVGEDRYTAIMSEKAEEGKLLHRFFSEILMEGDITKKDKKQYPQYEFPVGLLKLWVKNHVDRVVCSEMRYDQVALGVSGQLDAVLQLKGRTLPSVVDLKCVATLAKKTPIQIAGGYTLVGQPLKFDSAIALHLQKSDAGKTWKISVKEWPKKEFPRWQGYFLNCLSLYRYIYDGKEAPCGEEDF